LLLTNALLFVGEVARITLVAILTLTDKTFLTSLVHFLCLHYLNTSDVNTKYLETYLHGADSSLKSRSASQQIPPFMELRGSLPFSQGPALTIHNNTETFPAPVGFRAYDQSDYRYEC
jgi:hypothetical protein